jgi:hypothetical protein
MDSSAAIVGLLSKFPSVVAVHLRGPSVGDPEYADVTMYIEVRPFEDGLANELRRALSPLLGDSASGIHVQSVDHVHRQLIVGTREIWRRGHARGR